MRTDSRSLIAATTLTALLGVSACATVPASGVQTPTSADRPRAAVHRASSHAPSKVLDDRDPQVARLDPLLRAAVDRAAQDARASGIRFWITSGWRSRAHQQELLDAAIAKYGSRQEALRRVSSPDDSRHVSGQAVDIGPTEADIWLSEHGADHGLCQAFENEMWHFELLTEPGGNCPVMLPDATYR